MVAFISGLLVAAALAAHEFRVDAPAAVYGYVNKVVLEPDDASPKRMQVWGTFSVAAREPGAYHAPEGGYVYFELTTGFRGPVEEATELKRLADSGMTGSRVVAFGVREGSVRVRTPFVPPFVPDRYYSGNGVTIMSALDHSPAVDMLGQLPKPRSRMNYALVDKVVMEPETGQAERIQIWGTFKVGRGPGVVPYGDYAKPERGYLYFTLPPTDRPAEDVRAEWKDWASIAGTHRVVAFFIRIARGQDVRLRRPDEPPAAPDAYTPVSKAAFVVRPDTQYEPVRSLLAFR